MGCIFIYMTEKWIIDRIEEGLAVLEYGFDSIICPITNLPEGVREGSVLIKDGMNFLLDASEETAARSHRIREKFERLKKNS